MQYKHDTVILEAYKIDPAHDKTRLVRPAKTLISLRIRAGWSESSLVVCVFYNLRANQKGINENPCHTVWMYRLNMSICWSHRSYCRFCCELVHLMYCLIFKLVMKKNRIAPGHSISYKTGCLQSLSTACILLSLIRVFADTLSVAIEPKRFQADSEDWPSIKQCLVLR